MANPIDDDDRLAMAIGRAVSHWAHAEMHLASVFARITGLSLTMAVTIFQMFRSVRTQRECLSTVAKVSTNCEESDTATLASILADYEKLAKKRNEIAHNALGWHGADERKLYRVKRERVDKPDAFPYSPVFFSVEEVEALTVEVKSLVRRISKFNESLINRELAKLSLLVNSLHSDDQSAAMSRDAG